VLDVVEEPGSIRDIMSFGLVLPLGSAKSHIYNHGTVRRKLQQEIQSDQESVYIR
jgi:hypothetical protein